MMYAFFCWFLPELLEDGENGLSDFFRSLLAEGYQRLLELDAHIAFYTQSLMDYSRQNEACQRLQTIPGYGPIVASVFYSMVTYQRLRRLCD